MSLHSKVGESYGKKANFVESPQDKDLRESRSQRLLTIKSVRESIISFAGLSGKLIKNQNGSEIGSLVDVVVRWSQETRTRRIQVDNVTSSARLPPLTAL